MSFLYIAGIFTIVVFGIIYAAYKLGYSKKTESVLETELKNAKVAKDIRSGKPLDDKWLLPRD